MNTKERTAQQKETTIKYKQDLSKLQTLSAALKKHDKKLLDARFFETYFPYMDKETGQPSKDWKGKTITTFRLSKSTYSFSKHSNEIHYPYGNTINLESRETTHVKERIAQEITKLETCIKDSEEITEKLERTDEKAIIKDLLAIYKKHGQPSNWKDILDIYEVKYPEEM